MTVDSTHKKVHVGIDGSLHKVKAPVDIHSDHAVLRVVLPTELVAQELQESPEVGEEALEYLSGSES